MTRAYIDICVKCKAKGLGYKKPKGFICTSCQKKFFEELRKATNDQKIKMIEEFSGFTPEQQWENLIKALIEPDDDPYDIN